MERTIIEEIRNGLLALQDTGYKAFHSRLVPDTPPDSIIGVRTPELRKLAKKMAKDPRIGLFLDDLPHRFYEERSLHGFIICEEKDYSLLVNRLERFLPHIDNWGTCDLLSPKAFKRKENREQLLNDIRRWMTSDQPFTIRFGTEMLMSHFLGDAFQPAYLDWVAAIRNEHYYVRMMVAWFFATALAKQWQYTLPYLEKDMLEKWTHNKSIQKAIESYRITPEQKALLRTLRRH